MLPEAALSVADRLATPLMAFFRALGHLITQPAAPDPAHTLFARLSTLLLRLGRLTAFGRKPAPVARIRAADAGRPRPAATDQPTRRPLPRRPGWMLETLPDLAPTLAADLAPLLADPALATLLAADPGLQRALRPVLRGLGLPALTSAPPPTPPPPAHPRPPAAAAHSPPANRAARRAAASRQKHQRRIHRALFARLQRFVIVTTSRRVHERSVTHLRRAGGALRCADAPYRSG